MTRARVVPVGMTKEIRALLPTWLACTVAIGAGAVVADDRIIAAGMLAYGLGSIALGAQSIGHEYTHRTLALLLSQPSDRRRLLLLKFGVLTSMLLTLSVVAWIVLVEDNGEFTRPVRGPEPSLLVAAALSGLFVAPWLTMLCRSTLAGIVLTVVVPVSVLILGDIIGVARYGLGGGAQIDRFKLAFLWWGMFVVCATAAAGSWRMFMRLEAIDGRGPEVHLPQWLRLRSTEAEALESAVVRRHHPVWSLAKKELRLQQMTFVVVGLYILGWSALSLLERLKPEFGVVPLGPLTVMYCGLLSILIGSLASAEERQFGTLEWQVLLPMATSKQWIVKAAVALGLAILLGIGLPALLGYATWSDDDLRDFARSWRMTTVAVAVLTTGSLYLSSLCASGVRAMVLSLPVYVGVAVFIHVVTSAIFFYPFVRSTAGGLRRAIGAGHHVGSSESVMLVIAVSFIALLLRFGLVNHRSAERRATRIWRQAICIVGFLTLAVAL